MNKPFHAQDARSAISPAESARYTRDMLTELKVIADEQGQRTLAHLLVIARLEADALLRKRR